MDAGDRVVSVGCTRGSPPARPAPCGKREDSMNDAERDMLKEQLRAMAAGRGDGIDLDSPERWVMEGIKDPVPFFQNLDKLIPGDSILYFEGCDINPEVVRFYEQNKAAGAVCVTRDTIFPVPECFHVAMSAGVIERLVEFLKGKPVEGCFNHVKAYREGRLLFTFHDAFDGSHFLISSRVPGEAVEAFGLAIGATARREQNINKRDPAVLLRVLHAMEHPGELRANWPWWKKLLFFWKR